MTFSGVFSEFKSYCTKPKTQILFSILAFLGLVYFAVQREFELVYVTPFALVAILTAIYNFKNLWFLMLFALPLSFNFGDLALNLPIEGANITFPSDILNIGLILLMVFSLLHNKNTGLKYYNHPLTWLIVLNLTFLIFPIVNSTIPAVSIKNYLATLWLIGGFFWVSVFVFSDPENIKKGIKLISIGFFIALMIIFTKYAINGKNIFGLRINPRPVFHDHTVFGAFSPFYIPILFLFGFYSDFPPKQKLLWKGLFLSFVAGLFFSYSRGAWGSSALSMILMLGILEWKRVKKYAPIISLVLGGILILAVALSSGVTSGGQKAVSRKSFGQHILSMTNFKTDLSNKERINRWTSGFEMFKEKPWLGYGPGTWAFVYGDHQQTKYRTSVSTNRGDIGTAHNEFLLAANEAGIFGALIILFIFLYALFRCAKGFFLSDDNYHKLIYLGIGAGLFAYIFHSIVNNFLDTDKVGGTYYLFLAAIVALDIHRKKLSINSTSPAPSEPVA